MNWNLAAATTLASHRTSRRLYFFEEAAPEGARNVHHVYAPVEKHGVVLEADRESLLPNVNGFCGSIVGLESGGFRLYYTTTGSGAMRIGVAESSDGLSWTTCHLGQEKRDGFGDHLLVFDGVPSEELSESGDVVAADGRRITRDAPRNRQDQVAQPQVVRLPDGRWRMYYWHHQHGWGRLPYLYTIAESDDGLRWHAIDYATPALNSHWLGDQSDLSPQAALAEKHRRTNDANFLYWNQRLGCYEQFSQWFLDSHPDRRVEEDNCPQFNRVIQRRTSADGVAWSAPELVVLPDDHDPWDQQFYHLAVQYHDRWYIGSLGHYRVEHEQQTMDLELIFSLDGRRWERPMRSGFIPRSAEGRDTESVYPPNAWIDRGDRWLCLYTGTARKHNRHADRSLPSTCVMAASWPKHRMVGLSSGRGDGGNRRGGFLSEVFFPQGAEIRVDAAVRGWLRAELCDAWGRKIDGYRLGESLPVSGDDPGHLLTWSSGGTERFVHDPVRVRFEFEDADIYSVSY